jgi:CHAT domain-containing protein
MQRSLRAILSVFLSAGMSTTGAIASALMPLSTAQEPVPRAASPVYLNPEQLVQTLDRQDVQGAIRLVEKGWQRQFEDYYQGRLTNRYLEPDEMLLSLERLRRLTGQKTALVYIIPTPNHLELMVVTPGLKLTHHRVRAANRKALMELVQTFRQDVVKPFSAPRTYLPVAQRLYNWLIRPLQAELQAQQVDNLIFCLGTGLRSLPIAALHDGRQFLVEQYSVGIIPAFNLLDQNPAVLPGVRVLAMGAAEFQDQPPLPAVPLEVTTIAGNLWPGTSLLNQNFTLAQLRSQRARTPYGIVHLATHAEFLPGSVANSYIQFWDRRLRPTQFRELGLRVPVVQLLVLSACRTALGDAQAELGFAGLAVQSGSKAAIASLWAVSDTGTLIWMTEFYRQLKTAPTKAEALRRTQLAVLKGHSNATRNLLAQRSGQLSPPELNAIKTLNLSHPYYWAAFTLIGNPW